MDIDHLDISRLDIALVTADQAWAADDDSGLLVEALGRVGIHAGPVRWDDASADWASFEMAVLKSPWDYSDRISEFLDWADEVARLTSLHNPVEIVRWNTDKRYLGELAGLGLPVVPTRYLSPSDLPQADTSASGASEQLAAHLQEMLLAQLPDGTSDGTPTIGDGPRSIVVKPTVSAGSKDTARYDVDRIGDAARHALDLLEADREVMVQPYIDAVERIGETGLEFFGGEFSHAFRKGPLLSDGSSKVDGLFAVEQIEPRIPSSDELGLAERAIAIVSEKFHLSEVLYTRVDLLSDDNHQPFILELEMVEPSYFLTADPASPDRAAAAYRKALERVRLS